jgi:hypothetical protein
MKTILLVMLLLFLLVGGTWLYREYYVNIRLSRLVRQKLKVIGPLLNKLTSINDSDKADILRLVQEPSLRHSVFRILGKFNRMDLFPVDYLTPEKGAEGSLANWLEYPTELGTAPSEINLMGKVTLEEEDESLDYFVFRFRSDEPLWAPQGWMMGVAGPYRKTSQPYEVPPRVFSRFTALEKGSPRAEAEWVHKNVGR